MQINMTLFPLLSLATVTKVYEDINPNQISAKLGDFLKKNRAKKESIDKAAV